MVRMIGRGLVSYNRSRAAPGRAAKEIGRGMPPSDFSNLLLLVQLEALIAVIGVKREPYGAMFG
jgi:hypothetical protein